MRLSRNTLFVCVPVLFVGAALTGCASSSGGAQVAASDASASEAAVNQGERIEASSAVLRVRGMSCPKCANNITLKLKEVQGVNEVLINMGIGEVLVSFDDAVHPSRAELASAINGAGFTLESITER
jgi:copper chaperone CopZ